MTLIIITRRAENIFILELVWVIGMQILTNTPLIVHTVEASILGCAHKNQKRKVSKILGGGGQICT